MANIEKAGGGEDRKILYKSRHDRMVDGVCGGLAEYLNVDSTLVRILWALSVLIGGIGALVYLAAVIIVPPNPSHTGEKPPKKTNAGMIWGTGLVILGLLIVLNEYDIFSMLHFPDIFPLQGWWHMEWGSLISWLFILGGLALIYLALHQNVQKAGKKNNPKISPGLVRPVKHRMVGGVCAGIADHFRIDPTLIRLIVVLLALATHLFLWIVAYIIMSFVIPQETSAR